MLLLALTTLAHATLAHAEMPAYAGVGLGMGVAGPFVGVAGVVAWGASSSEKPQEAMTAHDFTPAGVAERRAQARARARWAVAGGSAAILGTASSLAGPPLLLAGGLVGSGDRTQAPGWIGVGLYGAALTATGIGLALKNEDPAPVLYAAAGIAYVGSLVAGGVQLAVSGAAEERAFVVPIAAGRF